MSYNIFDNPEIIIQIQKSIFNKLIVEEKYSIKTNIEKYNQMNIVDHKHFEQKYTFQNMYYRTNDNIQREISNEKDILNFSKYDEVIYLDNDMIAVRKEHKYALLNIQGEKITEFIYDEMIFLIENLIKVKQNQKYGIINHQGSLIVPVLYDGITIDMKQEQIMTDFMLKEQYYEQFKECMTICDFLIVAQLEQRIGYFNRQGQLVRPFTSLESVKENTSLEGFPIVLWVILAFVLSIILISLLIK